MCTGSGLGGPCVRPENQAAWQVVVERVKARRAVQEAYRQGGEELLRHPERLPVMVDEQGRPLPRE